VLKPLEIRNILKKKLHLNELVGVQLDIANGVYHPQVNESMVRILPTIKIPIEFD
jgi:hypothetical protein